MDDSVDAEFPSLFLHQSRVDWGVGVLSGEQDGKRRYLFEGGEERTMAAAHAQLMQRVVRPDRYQQAAYARLVALLAKRRPGQEAADSSGPTALVAQLDDFRKKYPTGFSGERWQGNPHNACVRLARAGAARRAQETLSLNAFERLARAKRLQDVWPEVVTVVKAGALSADLLQTTSSAEQLRLMGEGVRELLYGSNHYEKRFDGFLRRYSSTFRTPPSWQAATAICALVQPLDHVCVEPASFRKHLKAFARRTSLGAEPSGVAYVRCQAMARSLANELAAHGEVPEDLLEVLAFIRETA